MSISSWFPWRLAGQHKLRTRPADSSGLRRRGTRLAVEQLKDRTVPASYTAATVPELIADINKANHGGGSNTILLAANTNTAYWSYDNVQGKGFGGGVFIASNGTLYLDAFTFAGIAGNRDNSGNNTTTANVDGHYTLI